MGQRKIIAICGSMLYGEKEFSFILRLHKACRERGFVVIAFDLATNPYKHDADTMNEKALIEKISKFPCSALIILAETIKSPKICEYLRDSVEALNIPVFALDRDLEGCINIASKFGDGFKNMVRHVVCHHGCKKVNMIAGQKDNDFSEERIQVYKEVLAENNIPFEEKRLAYGDFWDRPAREAVKRFIEAGDMPEAIVCANDAMAIAACSELQENGFKVPEDVIVTGYDGIMSARLNYPPISTVAPDYSKEVEIIFELMEEVEKGNNPDTSYTRYIDFTVRANRSCGCILEEEKVTLELVNKLSYAFNDQKWQVGAMNSMLLSAAEKQHIQELTPLLVKAVDMWNQYFYFVGIRSDLMNSQSRPVDSVGGYNSLFHMEHGELQKTGEYYPDSVAIPGFSRLLQEDSGYSLFMLRLLFTEKDVFGYLMEGFDELNVRTMRRCDEFGMFISTAISEIVKNEKLFWFNERLKQLNHEMERAALHDPLTGLYNRRGFFDELTRISKASVGRYITFFSIDMDGLKQINDKYGHNEGDVAISMMADAIRHFSARNGICARFGGDEFICALITDRPLSLSADTVRERLNKLLEDKHELSAKPYSISASIGQECIRIGSYIDFDEILRKIDEKMYLDKRARKKERED